jgi:hypothetical protein
MILSQEFDYSTIDITHWLKHYNIPFVRLNGEESYWLEKVIIDKTVDFIISWLSIEMKMASYTCEWEDWSANPLKEKAKKHYELA